MSSSLHLAVPCVFRALAARPSQLATRQYHRNRLVPIRSMFDDFFNHRYRPWPLRMMEDHMRNMERLVDSMIPRNRFWDPDFSVNTRAARDVEVKYNAKEFEVKLEVDSYKPEDLNVKIVGDELSISGKIKETDAHGSVTSEFSRQFTIPENVDIESIESMFTNDGHLVVKGKIKGSEGIPERTININREASSGGEKASEGKSSTEK